jgi:hypothetical protein
MSPLSFVQKSEPGLPFRSALLLAGLSLFFVVFLWGFFDNFVGALGLNMTVFLGLLLLFFRDIARQKGVDCRETLYWLTPLAMIALSYALFENPYLRAVSIFVFLFAGLLFSAHALYGAGRERTWSLPYVFMLLFAYVGAVPKVSRPFVALVPPSADRSTVGRTAFRILAGVALFALLAGFVVIPLLSSVESGFASLMERISDIVDLLSADTWARIVFATFVFSFFGSIGALWLERKQIFLRESEPKVDSVVSGIVVGGVAFLYLAFILIQIGHLWNDTLPFAFQETERMVKSGFWQLFLLTLINILFFAGLQYRPIHRSVRLILNAFVVLSLLLVASAAQRVFLYAYYYGLSYEKFFAAYTVLFCIGVFAWFLWIVFRKRRVDIVKGLAFAALWAYAAATLLPIEQIVIHTNVALDRLPESRIRLGEMRMLSPDVLGYVVGNYPSVVRASRGDSEEALSRADEMTWYDPYPLMKEVDPAARHWAEWVRDRYQDLRGRRFYEMSLSGAWNLYEYDRMWRKETEKRLDTTMEALEKGRCVPNGC